MTGTGMTQTFARTVLMKESGIPATLRAFVTQIDAPRAIACIERVTTKGIMRSLATANPLTDPAMVPTATMMRQAMIGLPPLLMNMAPMIPLNAMTAVRERSIPPRMRTAAMPSDSRPREDDWCGLEMFRQSEEIGHDERQDNGDAAENHE